MERFYAKDKDVPWVVAIFKTEKDRDDWVNYKDYETLKLPPEDEEYKSRVAITYDEALDLTDCMILDVNSYVADEILDHIMYCSSWQIEFNN